MVKRPIIHKPRFWLKWSVFLISWTFSVLTLGIVIFSGDSELSTSSHYASSADLDFRPPKNQIEAFFYRRWDPNENNRPIYSVNFENLGSENNKLGIFKTALHKVVKIQDLELKFYQYDSDNLTEVNTSDIFVIPEEITNYTRALVKKIMARVTTVTNGWRVNNIDIGNVSEVRVNNFDYQIFHEGDLFFAVQSKRAIVSGGNSYVVLRGHAKITIADGSTLESNHIEWDVKQQHFKAKGVYVLNRGGIITTGKGICLDAELRSISGQFAKSKQKEQKCIAKL